MYVLYTSQTKNEDFGFDIFEKKGPYGFINSVVLRGLM